MTTAILVDGAFYQKRAEALFGTKSAEERASELIAYCMRHVSYQDNTSNSRHNYLYRIFYYDCHPSEKNIYHPLLKQSIDLRKTDLYKWSNAFHQALTSKRKVALRMGELLESAAGYSLKPDAVKKLCRKTITVDDLTEADFYLDIQQKGVDMKIGLDISSLSYKHLVDQIVLIAGDSDFVPAAKHARREGIDFILDPMWNPIKPSLMEHIDGLRSVVKKYPDNLKDPLCNIFPPEKPSESLNPST
jgi:uncharacterized LabA/DUF88 family protein